MEKEGEKRCGMCWTKAPGSNHGAYGLGFIGALIYFLQHATSFWQGALGILKAAVWPAVLVYKLLEFLQK